MTTPNLGLYVRGPLGCEKGTNGAADQTDFDANMSAIDSAVGALQGGGGNGAIQTVSVTLTASQINNLGNTPIQLVAAPGAGKVIVPISISVKYTKGSAAFSISNGQGNFTLQAGTTWANVNMSGFIDQSSNQFASYPTSQVQSGATEFENQALTVGNNWGNTASGGSGSTATIVVAYMVITA
jgi:hypothetical protein